MKNNNQQTILETLAFLGMAYPRFELTKETMQVYASMLEDIDPEQLKLAAKVCAASQNFFPSVYELRSAVGELNRKSARLPTAYEAYEDACKDHPEGYTIIAENDTPEYIEEIKKRFAWSHPLVRKVAKQLGWPDRFPTDNPGVDRAHFFKAWDAAVADQISDTIMLPEVREYIDGSKQLEAGSDI